MKSDGPWFCALVGAFLTRHSEHAVFALAVVSLQMSDGSVFVAFVGASQQKSDGSGHDAFAVAYLPRSDVHGLAATDGASLWRSDVPGLGASGAASLQKNGGAVFSCPDGLDRCPLNTDLVG